MLGRYGAPVPRLLEGPLRPPLAPLRHAHPPLPLPLPRWWRGQPLGATLPAVPEQARPPRREEAAEETAPGAPAQQGARRGGGAGAGTPRAHPLPRARGEGPRLPALAFGGLVLPQMRGGER